MKNDPAHSQSGRWLLTGASGRIGRMLVRHWRGSPPSHRLVLQGRHEGAELVWDPLISQLPKDAGEFSCLIAFAGVTPTTGLELDLNVALAEATLSAAYDANIQRVLLTSSSSVYGAPCDGKAFSETAPPRPLNAYGSAKLAMEAACTPWRERGVEICCLRIGNVIGADALLVQGMKATKQTPLKLDRFATGGGPRRSYIGPATLAEVLESLATSTGPLPEILNVAAPRPVSMEELATEARLDWVWTPAPETALEYIALDCSLLSTLHRFDKADSTPTQMIRQWTRLKDPA